MDTAVDMPMTLDVEGVVKYCIATNDIKVMLGTFPAMSRDIAQAIIDGELEWHVRGTDLIVDSPVLPNS